ncbi:glycoside hydrolase [Tothia fuscella]|uniref:Glycoside hydrolase n=1 Tax=Tothia fuscella TaxID=1048955 RepID=A0A9P4NQB0_9PEZI|nr:glycoside hydrolase [Tothia fuscella]
MKYGQIAIVLAELSLVVLAQPHRHHQHKRAIITATIWETVQAPDVLVWVDEHGNLISGGVAAPTPAPQPAVPASSVNSPAPVPAAPTPKPVAPVVPAPPAQMAKAPPAPAPAAPAPAPPVQAPPAPQAPVQPASPAPAQPAPQAPKPVESKNNNVNAPADADIDQTARAAYGISWSGYKGDENYSPCKTMADADRDWSMLNAYGTIRIYGTDCDQPNIALKLATKYNKKVVLGIYHLDSTLGEQMRTIHDAAKDNGGYALVDSITVGNEDVNEGRRSVGQVIASVTAARAFFRLRGYKGPILHVDTQNAFLEHPELCGHAAGDYIGANIHAYFNPHTQADQAGDFVANQIDLLRQCGQTSWKRRNVRVRVMETGWPTQGDNNGVAVPSKKNQATAMASIKSRIANDVFMFSAFNNYWKKNTPETHNTEHFWGMFSD